MPAEGQTRTHREGGVGIAPPRDHGDRRVGLVSDHPHVFDAQEPCHLLGDRCGDLRRRRLARDERRHAPQRGLLLREATRVGPRLGVRDRRRQQLRELGQPRLGVLWERLLTGRGGKRHAPHAAVDHDRDADRGPDRELPHLLDERPVERQLQRPEPHCAPVVAHRPQRVVQGPPGADRNACVRGAPGGHERHRVVGLEAHQGRRIGAHEPADLLVDRREQLVLRHAAGDERRHAPQRRLLLRQLRALGPRWHVYHVLAICVLGRVVARVGDDAPVAHAVDLAHRALRAQRPE